MIITREIKTLVNLSGISINRLSNNWTQQFLMSNCACYIQCEILKRQSVTVIYSMGKIRLVLSNGQKHRVIRWSGINQ